MGEKESAAILVSRVVPGSYPTVVRERLTGHAKKILADGTDCVVVEEALRLWISKTGVSPSFLPFLVCDVLKMRARVDQREVMRACWKTGDTTPLEQFGHMWIAPPIPADLTDVSAIRSFMLAAKRDWIEQLEHDLAPSVGC